jgi:hypothetical protein
VRLSAAVLQPELAGKKITTSAPVEQKKKGLFSRFFGKG